MVNIGLLYVGLLAIELEGKGKTLHSGVTSGIHTNSYIPFIHL